MAIERTFANAGDFSEGLAPVTVNGRNWGYIDKTGEFVIQPKFEFCRNFSEGRAAVQMNGKWGFIDRDDRLIVESVFEQVGDFSEGLACVNIGGEMAGFWAKGSSARVVGYGRWGYIKKDGDFAIDPASGLFRAERFSEGLARFAIDRKGTSPPEHGYPSLRWGYMDNTGETRIEPKFDHAYDFSQGLARVEIWGRILPARSKGYIDKQGKYVWKPSW